MSGAREPGRPSQSVRDLRLDFFRGLALWFIFIDHVPSSRIAQFTLRNYGFSDATEIFVFIAGFSASVMYGRLLARAGWWFMSANALRRCWQLYIAHVVLCVLFVAQVAYVATRFNNPMFMEELNVTRLLESPDRALIDMLLLHLRPVNLDILPLYIALLMTLPVLIWCLRRRPWWVFAVSLVVYVGVRREGWAWPVYADGDTWFFNPLGWQFLFVIGGLCGCAAPGYRRIVQWRPWLGGVCGAYLLFAAWLALSWQYPILEATVPDWLGPYLYPIDKTNLDVLRLLHFLAMAYLVRHFVRPDAGFLSSPFWRPILICGQNSLHVFCLGIYLSFGAFFLLVEVSDALPMQILVVLAGLVLMTALAEMLAWYRGKERRLERGSAPR